MCGFLGCDPRSYDPLLDALPCVLHVKQIDGRLKHLVDLALAEVDGAGAASVRERLSNRCSSRRCASPAQAWTLVSLAKRVGASRSVLADRFAKIVGHPPMQYLARWRMQTAARLLREGGMTVSEVAHEVGYESEAAFSRAFKKTIGLAPAAYVATG